jgi:hypothetical protein
MAEVTGRRPALAQERIGPACARRQCRNGIVAKCPGCLWSIASLGRLIYWLPQLRSRTVITSDGPIRLREVPEPREWLLDCTALDDNKPPRGAAKPGARANLRRQPVCQRDRDHEQKNKRTVPICPTACFWLNCRWRAFGAPRGRGDVLGAERRGSCWQSAPNVGERYTSSLRCDGENLASEIELERMIAAS